MVRGWPLTVDGLLHNADATHRRYSRGGGPFLAISAEVTVLGWDLNVILAGPRLRTRRSYATAPVGAVVEGGFALVPTFAAPHYSVVLSAYNEPVAQRLLDILGEAWRNPYHER